VSLGKVNRLINMRCVKGLLRVSGILGTVIIKACLVCFVAVCFYLRYGYKVILMLLFINIIHEMFRAC
jgi:hypothetical protein